MRATAVLESSLYATDLDAALAFYTLVMGLSLHSSVAGRHLFFRCGRAMVLIFNPAATAAASGSPVPTHGAIGPGHLCFCALNAHEIALWREHLAAHAVPVEAEVTWPTGAVSLYFRDPAGNSLEIAEARLWQG